MKSAVVVFVLAIGFLGGLAKSPSANSEYLSPGELAVSPDGLWLYVLCERSDELLAVDTRTQRVAKAVRVGHVPRGLSVSADGRRIYVANSWTDDISVIDSHSFQVSRTLPTGFEPISVVADSADKTLYVANRLSNDISVLDLVSGRESKRLTAGRGASYLALSADGKQVFCTHIYPNLKAVRAAPDSEITVIDTATQRVTERKVLHNVAGVFHIQGSNDGRLTAAAQLRPHNLIPMAHVEHGWVFGNSLSIFGKDVDGGVLQVPLDEMELYAALPFGIAITPDKAKIFITASGSDEVTVINVARLLRFARARRTPFANDLSASANYISRRIPVGRNPRGLVLSPDGSRLFVANRMDDTVTVLDVRTEEVFSTVDLGRPKTISPLRRGEQAFYAAKYSFQGQFSCANCHLDVTFDGLEWDLEPDGFGVDIVDNRSIEDLSGTQPFKWNGGNPDLPTECGPRTEKFIYRSQSFNEQELTDLVSFVMALPYRPNRYRLVNGDLSPAQERGKTIFERTKYKDGRRIPESNQCGYCHSGPKFTNNKQVDVGTGKPTDRSPIIDVPHLPNVAYSAPYLHDGSARSLEEIWTVFNPKDTHGVTNDLTKDELNDLIEYLRTL